MSKFQFARSSRRATTLALAVLTLTSAACSSSDDGFEPEVQTMRVSVVGQAPITISSAGVQSGTLNIAQGSATTITVTFLDAANANAMVGNEDTFQAAVTPAVGSGLTFARTGAYTGTLTGTLTGTRTIGLALLHIAENHEDFGPFNVNFNVTAPPMIAVR